MSDHGQKAIRPLTKQHQNKKDLNKTGIRSKSVTMFFLRPFACEAVFAFESFESETFSSKTCFLKIFFFILIPFRQRSDVFLICDLTSQAVTSNVWCCFPEACPKSYTLPSKSTVDRQYRQIVETSSWTSTNLDHVPSFSLLSLTRFIISSRLLPGLCAFFLPLTFAYVNFIIWTFFSNNILWLIFLLYCQWLTVSWQHSQF